MKFKQLILAVVATALAVSSCDKEKTDIGFELGQQFALAFQQTAISTDGTIEVRFKERLTDSRCPTDVVCVWEGEASIAIDVTVNNIDEQISLSTHPEFGQKDTVGQLVFTLVDLQPYPCCHDQEIDQEAYVAELLVESL